MLFLPRVKLQFLIKVFSVLLCAGQGFSLFGQQEILQREIGEIIHYEANIDFRIVPGLQVGVLDSDSMYVCSYGDGIAQEGIYELGSLTKPMVAWLVQAVVDSLGWGMDESLCRYLPDSLCTGAWKQTTIEQVLQHNAGLPRIPPGIGESEQDINDPYSGYTMESFAQDLSSIRPVPGKYGYSHIGYASFHWLFEKVGGLEFFTKNKLTEFLGLHQTVWQLPDSLVAPGHGLNGKPIPPSHMDALKTALGLKSSMKDMLHLINRLSIELKQESQDWSKTFKKELTAFPKSGKYKMSHGWFLVSSGSSVVYFHTGHTAGHYVSVAFMPELHIGVVVIANGAAGPNDLSLLVLDMLKRAKR